MSPVKPEPFWDKVDRTGGPDACWPWLRHLSTGGYGRQDKIAAHRMAYELLVGPIPEGLELDHLCHVRRCVNPAHLEPVTHAENLRRSPTASTINAAKTHCANGHPYDEVNTVRRRSGRRCRVCLYAACRRWRANVRARDQKEHVQ